MDALTGVQTGSDDLLASRVSALRHYLEAGLVARSSLVERLLITLLGGGHLLLEGAPGLGKTRTVKMLSAGLSCSFARVQCTPDLMPSDLTGMQVFRPERGVVDFVPGPVFNSLVLVDEVNRAPPKVQSALLEAMAERQVTVSNETHRLPDPFMVVATQNPIEHEGTFPLPEAQLDRFLLHVVLGMPDAEAELGILELVERETTAATADGTPERVGLDDIRAARAAAAEVYLSPALKDYIVRLVTATRGGNAAPEVSRALAHPVSPRGSLALAACSRARAWLDGRDFATPEDVAALAADALAHRMVVNWQAAADGVTARALVARLSDLVQPL